MHTLKFIFMGLTCIFTANGQIQESHSKTLPDKITPIEDNSSSSHELHQEYPNHTAPTERPKWSEWSSWSRCKKCVQQRMKICLLTPCDYTKIYQERRCGKKKCTRKRKRRKDEFHVVLREKKISPRTGDPTIWSGWSEWSTCSHNCRTYRKRYCTKLGRCKKKREIQKAYCYRGNTECEMYVFNLMQTENKYSDSKMYTLHDTAVRRRRLLNNSPSCGLQYKRTYMLKIIGGNESPRYKWPWHVALINQYGEVFCGGTLIASEWVLTASHCIRSFLIVRLNEHDLTYTEGRELELFISKSYQHPEFNQRTVNGDIALLQLPFPVKTPIACLPHRKPQPQELCSVMGWGKTRSSARRGVTRLRESRIPIVEEDTCKWAYKELPITDNMLCAGWRSGKSDTCAGDSGGGLMCTQKRTKNGGVVYEVQGITSFGKGCGRRNKYGIYTLVYNYLDWIEYIMGRYSTTK
ncbi:coagulation factor X-like [Coccinella septempunctata]|uniref:coagulation factor X-like n=1 Tax=Coccinella septempunctata TaxID=41139 RepID=UPI001D07A3C4|nr:coagulation factor X-like [Coccinella septempunctata]